MEPFFDRLKLTNQLRNLKWVRASRTSIKNITKAIDVGPTPKVAVEQCI
jgi:hypothetical protein